MADVKISQMGQQSATQPFYEVVIGTKRYVIGCDGGSVMVAKPKAWLINLGYSQTVADKFSDPDSTLTSAMNLNANGATNLDSRFPVAGLGDGFQMATGFDRSTDWAAGYPKDTKTFTAGSGGTTTTTTTGGTTTTGTTTSTGTSTSTGTTIGTTIFSAPDTATTVESFLSKYWWAVLLVAVALLWKPVIAPALGISHRRRRR